MKNFNYILRQLIFPAFLLLAFGLRAQPEGIKLSQPWVFSKSFDKALYKGRLTAYGNELSGLFFIKRTDESFHFIFMSEVGLKYFDIEVGTADPDDYRIHYLMDALDRKPLQAFLQTTFRMLSLSWGEHEEKLNFICEGSGERVVVVKSKTNGKFRYDYHPNFGQVSLLWHYGFLKKKLTIEPEDYDFRAPSSILASQKKIQLRLKRIKK